MMIMMMMMMMMMRMFPVFVAGRVITYMYIKYIAINYKSLYIYIYTNRDKYLQNNGISKRISN